MIGQINFNFESIGIYLVIREGMSNPKLFVKSLAIIYIVIFFIIVLVSLTVIFAYGELNARLLPFYYYKGFNFMFALQLGFFVLNPYSSASMNISNIFMFQQFSFF